MSNETATLVKLSAAEQAAAIKKGDVTSRELVEAHLKVIEAAEPSIKGFDVGNIWFLGQGGYGEESQFKIDRFYKQLGFNTGLGARFDFSFFVFRIDWGIKLHNPNEAAGQRWIQNFRMQNTTLNFGVGYPF